MDRSVAVINLTQTPQLAGYYDDANRLAKNILVA